MMLTLDVPGWHTHTTTDVHGACLANSRAFYWQSTAEDVQEVTKSKALTKSRASSNCPAPLLSLRQHCLGAISSCRHSPRTSSCRHSPRIHTAAIRASTLY